MKKALKFILCVIFIVAICASLISCGALGLKNKIDFGAKYKINDDKYYVFNADGTGYCEYYHNYDLDSYKDTLSGRVDFIWKEAADGAIYLFKAEEHLNDDHSSSSAIPLISDPIYFGDGFFTYQHDGKTQHCVKEGSEIEKALEDN